MSIDAVTCVNCQSCLETDFPAGGAAGLSKGGRAEGFDTRLGSDEITHINMILGDMIDSIKI
jgi:hypothetical protein